MSQNHLEYERLDRFINGTVIPEEKILLAACEGKIKYYKILESEKTLHQIGLERFIFEAFSLKNAKEFYFTGEIKPTWFELLESMLRNPLWREKQKKDIYTKENLFIKVSEIERIFLQFNDKTPPLLALALKCWRGLFGYNFYPSHPLKTTGNIVKNWLNKNEQFLELNLSDTDSNKLITMIKPSEWRKKKIYKPFPNLSGKNNKNHPLVADELIAAVDIWKELIFEGRGIYTCEDIKKKTDPYRIKEKLNNKSLGDRLDFILNPNP